MTDKRDSAANQLNSVGCSRATGTLTTSNGRPIESITASLTSGPQGAIALKDFTLMDHLAAFDRERIPERVVHAKGAGAFGYFQVTSPEITKYCSAKLFNAVGKRTPAAVRFSTVGGESGSADTARDPRGFAMKFYTEEGNWDLVGNNTPIFFIRDPILFPSFIHTQKRNPATHCKDPDAFWDFISLRPETTHQVSFLFSDRGTPDGYRHMNGYGSHTFKTVNETGVAFYVKWHFKTDQGVKNLTSAAADQLASSDPDYAIRDLYNAIDTSNYPSWTAYFQVMSVDQASKLPYNPFDVTKVLHFFFRLFVFYKRISEYIDECCGLSIDVIIVRFGRTQSFPSRRSVVWCWTAIPPITSQRWNSWPSRPPTWYPASRPLPTRCCRPGYSRTPTRIATASA